VAGSCDPKQGLGVQLYDPHQRSELPDAAVLASLGCGNPMMVAELLEGETVLDLGSGGGIDVLLSAKRVGPTGRAYGLDMTDEMLDLARRNAEEAGVANVEFLKGYIEDVPLPDALVDVIISLITLGLSVDKLITQLEMITWIRNRKQPYGGDDGHADPRIHGDQGPADRALGQPRGPGRGGPRWSTRIFTASTS